ncbi:molybdopterin-binding protein [Aureimonas psammosilenae]|uniref:molybdopterin-binding protein n=1 Tax=Aureimonas psammosilenae TaxID=2495496 RepID=UPI002E25D2A3
MKFGSVPVTEAEGVILAHAAGLPDGRIAKGTRLGRDELARLASGGVATVIGAMLAEGDVPENDAAAVLAQALAGGAVRVAPAATGRANLFAEENGLFLADRQAVDRLNEIDPGITLATLPEYAPVTAGQMIATVKIIPLALSGIAVARGLEAIGASPPLRVAAYRPARVALVQTMLPGIKDSVLQKTKRSLDARLAPSSSSLVEEQRCAHDPDALRETLLRLRPAELVVIFGASAVIDRRDVIPAAIEDAGGAVHQFGMPVDPGNLLLFGTFRDNPILGAPGCARSPKENGFDWVLNRLLAGVEVSPQDIRRMGVGGLLGEIPTRPSPRALVGE